MISMLSQLFNRNSSRKRLSLLYHIGIFANLIDMFEEENIDGFSVIDEENRTATLCYGGYHFTLIVKQIYIEVEVEKNGVREKVVTYCMAEDVAKEWHHKDREIRTLAKDFFEHFLLLAYNHINYNSHDITIENHVRINRKLQEWKTLKRKYDNFTSMRREYF